MVKRNIILSILITGLILVSCTSASYKKEINENGRSWMDSFMNKDADDIYDSFSKEKKENSAKTIKEEIEDALEFIDGKITHSEYLGTGAEMVSKDNYKVSYYYCDVEFDLFTDTDKCYHVDMSYDYINEDNPEKVGVNNIRINHYEKEDSDYYQRGEEVWIGKK